MSLFLQRQALRKLSAGGVDAILKEDGDILLLEAGTQINKDTSIPAASDAATLTGDEYVAIVQSGTTYRLKTRTLAEYLNG